MNCVDSIQRRRHSERMLPGGLVGYGQGVFDELSYVDTLNDRAIVPVVIGGQKMELDFVSAMMNDDYVAMLFGIGDGQYVLASLSVFEANDAGIQATKLTLSRYDASGFARAFTMDHIDGSGGVAPAIELREGSVHIELGEDLLLEPFLEGGYFGPRCDQYKEMLDAVDETSFAIENLKALEDFK